MQKQWTIEVSDEQGNVSVDPVATVAVLRSVLSALNDEPLPETVNEISLLLTHNSDIHLLNSDYRGKDSPTDVLSFSQLEGESFPGVPQTCLGDLVISTERCAEQCEEFGNTPDQEMLRLLIHGTLHLMGYDHEDVPQSEVERMQNKEDEIFTALCTELPPLFKNSTESGQS